MVSPRLNVHHEADQKNLTGDDGRVHRDSRAPFEVRLASAGVALAAAALEAEPKAEGARLSSGAIVAEHWLAATAEEVEVQSACRKSEIRNWTGREHLVAQ